MSENLVFFVGGAARTVDRDLWDHLLGPRPAPGFRCDGCTKSPDKIGKYIFWPACAIHDWHQKAEANVHRLVGNLTFRINIWRCLRFQGAPRWLAAKAAVVYWTGGSIGSLWAHRRDKAA